MNKAKRTVVYRGHWNSVLVEIIDQGKTRTLYFGGNVLQSSIDLSAPHRLYLSYTRYMMSGLLFKPAPQNILMVGLGAGSMVHFLHHHYPDSRIDVVEHAELVIELARGYFSLPENSQVTIHCADGYDFIRAHPNKTYDLVIIDAFDHRGMAANIYNQSYLRQLKKVLVDTGLVSFNLWSGNQDKMIEIRALVENDFNCLLEFPVYNRGNVICLASDSLTRPHLLRLRNAVISSASKRFSIDFKPIINQGLKHNFSVYQRLGRLFH
ncbi:MAG: methyltransferase domain-containing protein [Desulfobulbaceae bacterium]|nr:MAG: methyltransferase domain-containing protein [Desulfobulbaceae bacterium]